MLTSIAVLIPVTTLVLVVVIVVIVAIVIIFGVLCVGVPPTFDGQGQQC
jgi:hypothetical protein